MYVHYGFLNHCPQFGWAWVGYGIGDLPVGSKRSRKAQCPLNVSDMTGFHLHIPLLKNVATFALIACLIFYQHGHLHLSRCLGIKDIPWLKDSSGSQIIFGLLVGAALAIDLGFFRLD